MNIYQILETLKRVEEGPATMAEGQMKHHMWDMAERLSLDQFLEMFPDSEDFYLGVHGVDSREELEQADQPEKQSESMDDDDGGYVDDPNAHATVNRAGFNKLTPQSYADKIDFIDRQLADPRQQQNWPEFKQRRLDLMTAAQRAGIVKEGGKFRFANPKQRPGDQVRGTEKAVRKKGQHPFKGRLVGTDESKLDEKCWDGYQQQGMKKKGDRQVPNCVPVEEEYEAYMNELVGTYGMTSGGTATGGNTKTNTQAGQEIDTITKNLQNLKSKVPDLNIQKATAALSKADNDDSLSSQDKDAASALADPVANLIKDPQLGQQLKQLIDKGMQKDQAAAQLAKQKSGA
jgi:hypothetical protein